MWSANLQDGSFSDASRYSNRVSENYYHVSTMKPAELAITVRADAVQDELLSASLQRLLNKASHFSSIRIAEKIKGERNY